MFIMIIIIIIIIIIIHNTSCAGFVCKIIVEIR